MSLVHKTTLSRARNHWPCQIHFCDKLVDGRLGGLLDRSTIDDTSIKNRSKRESRTRCKLGWGLAGSWSDLCSGFVPMWETSRSQVGTKVESKGFQDKAKKSLNSQDASDDDGDM